MKLLYVKCVGTESQCVGKSLVTFGQGQTEPFFLNFLLFTIF